VPAHLEALTSPDHALLALHISGQPQPVPFILQARSDGARALQFVPTAGSCRLACNDYRSLLLACTSGLGIAQLPQPLALEALRSGALKCVLPAHAPEGWQLFIHFPSRKQLPARVRAFVDFCIEQFGGHPDLSADLTAFNA
jgi:DNA-binding transcriptional LysR family regulator